MHTPAHRLRFGLVGSPLPKEQSLTIDRLHVASLEVYATLARIYAQHEPLRKSNESKVDRMAAALVAGRIDVRTGRLQPGFAVCEIMANEVPQNDPTTVNKETRELFLRKAGARALAQAETNRVTDLSPMVDIPHLKMNELYRHCAATAGDVHVGVAGPFAHHSRHLACVFASILSVDAIYDPLVPIPIDAAFEIDTGDNTDSFNKFLGYSWVVQQAQDL